MLPVLAWLEEFAADGLAMLVSALLVAGYYLHLRSQARKDPTYSIHAVNALARRYWTESVMTSAGKDIMAVQTLRNFIMVSIMMASTASVLIIGTLTLSGQADNITRSWHNLSLFGSHSTGLWIIKVLCLLVDFIIAFFAYAMSMRLATHVLFMLNVPPESYRNHPALSPESVANRLIQAGNLIAVGMRAFLFAIPLVFWLFGPVFLVLATIGLVVALARLDRHELADGKVALPAAAPAESGRTVPFPRSKKR
jgi:uncharacterized membrane protein